MKQTAVQLVYKLLKSGLSPEKVVNYLLIDEDLVLEKEKEQMIDFARDIIIDATCSVEGYVTTEKDIEDYYNETFNTNER
jgi:hypothetical protein